MAESVQLLLKKIEAERKWNYRQTRDRRVRTEAEALAFIAEVGFLPLMNLAEVDLPSLHASNDPGRSFAQMNWWDWKETLPEKKACYYAKVLRGRGTFISWKFFPCFCRLYGRSSSYEEDFRQGLLSRQEKRVLDLLSERGPLRTRELRLLFGEPSRANTRALHRALASLQRSFRVTVCGGDLEGWSHHRWDLVERYVPWQRLRAAWSLKPAEARQRLAHKLVQTAVISTAADIAWLFGWPRPSAEETIAELLSAGRLIRVEVQGLEGEYVATRQTGERLTRSRPRR